MLSVKFLASHVIFGFFFVMDFFVFKFFKLTLVCLIGGRASLPQFLITLFIDRLLFRILNVFYFFNVLFARRIAIYPVATQELVGVCANRNSESTWALKFWARL